MIAAPPVLRRVPVARQRGARPGWSSTTGASSRDRWRIRLERRRNACGRFFRFLRRNCAAAPRAGPFRPPQSWSSYTPHRSILDDLPSMDDAPLRRGRKANHLEFGEAIAILAAFGLLNLAYGTLVRAYEPDSRRGWRRSCSDAVGLDGLIGGQAIDLLATDQQISFETLERIHRGKTGALFSASATAGAIVSGASPEVVRSLAAYAKNLGLAFQIIDDLLDVEGDPSRNRQGRPRGCQEDDVRVVQRHSRRAPARAGALPDRGSARSNHLAGAPIVFASSRHLSRAEAGNVRA